MCFKYPKPVFELKPDQPAVTLPIHSDLPQFMLNIKHYNHEALMAHGFQLSK